MNEELKWFKLTGILLFISLISGGASAILVNGIAYDIIYAIHKISSVIAAIFFVLLILKRKKFDESKGERSSAV